MDNSDLLNEMRKTTRLLALIATKDMSQKDAIAILSKAGFQPKEIGEFLNTTSNTVNVALSTMRKNKKKQNTRKVSLRDES